MLESHRGTPREAPVDAELESSSGGARRLASHRGRVLVLFWEDRDHNRGNAALKEELNRLASPASGGLVVLAVGDVSTFDFGPARAMVRATIRALARAIGVEIWLDWKGALASPPFGLRRGQSNVMVLDREGRPVLRRHGELDASQRRELLEVVRGLGVASDRAA